MKLYECCVNTCDAKRDVQLPDSSATASADEHDSTQTAKLYECVVNTCDAKREVQLPDCSKPAGDESSLTQRLKVVEDSLRLQMSLGVSHLQQVEEFPCGTWAAEQCSGTRSRSAASPQQGASRHG